MPPKQFYNDPEEWGPHYWYMMRCVAYNYPMNPTNRERLNIKRFYENIGNVLPCEKCIAHYKELWVKYPIDDNLCCTDCLVNWVEKIYEETKRKKKY